MKPVVTSETTSLAERIRAAVTKGELNLPPLPEVVTRLQELLRDEDRADARRASDLIRRDPAIAASVLRMANSAFFGGLRSVSDLNEAIMRLGLRQLGSVVTATAHKGNFVSNDPERMNRLHALAATKLAASGGGDRAEAYLAGLLHDTGKLVVLKGLDDMERRDAKMRVSAAVAEELMEALHPQLGFTVLENWKIPAPVCHVARHHHDPEPAAEDRLLLQVQAANAFAHKIAPRHDADRDVSLLTLPAVERANLSEFQVATMLVDLEDELAEARSLF
jgi:HD-like signal output (HDOD) protein